jgi:hypothetical protein
MFVVKIHDIVETSKMSMEYSGALIDVLRSAKTDLDNGRLVVRDGNEYKYPADITADELFLVTTPEKTYENVSLTEFYNKAGKKIRAVRVMLGDIFGTTAFEGTLAIGDKVMVKAGTGELVKSDGEPVVEFEIVERRAIGGFPMIVVERVQ